MSSAVEPPVAAPAAARSLVAISIVPGVETSGTNAAGSAVASRDDVHLDRILPRNTPQNMLAHAGGVAGAPSIQYGAHA